MRITIEVDQNDTTSPVTATSGDVQSAGDAGGPPEQLLADLGEAPDAAMADVVAAGAPPAWLIQAIEAAAMSEPDTSDSPAPATDGNSADGGAAPNDE